MAIVKKQFVHNRTSFSMDEIKGFKFLGSMRNNWRQRHVALYQHPTQQDSVVSVGTSYDNSEIVIAEESKESFGHALKYASEGKVYVYN